jgi:hypothetical protein
VCLDLISVTDLLDADHDGQEDRFPAYVIGDGVLVDMEEELTSEHQHVENETRDREDGTEYLVNNLIRHSAILDHNDRFY